MSVLLRYGLPPITSQPENPHLLCRCSFLNRSVPLRSPHNPGRSGKRETAFSTPLRPQTRRAEVASLHLCRGYTLRRLQFLRYDFGHTPSLPSPPVSSSLTAPVLRLRSVTQATSAAPTRPYQRCWHRTQTRPSCKSRKDRTTSPEHIPARLLPRRTGLPAHSPEIFKTTAAAVPSKTSSESSGEVNAMFNVSAKLDRLPLFSDGNEIHIYNHWISGQISVNLTTGNSC